jgi:hypothetical protein
MDFTADNIESFVSYSVADWANVVPFNQHYEEKKTENQFYAPISACLLTKHIAAAGC